MYSHFYLKIGAAVLAMTISTVVLSQSAQWSMRTHQELGEAQELFEQKKYDLAAKRYADLLKHEDHPKARFLAFMGLADVSALRGDVEEAAEYYEQALAIDQPDDDDKLLQIAEVFLASGKLDEAFDHYQDYARANPDDRLSSDRLEGLKSRDQFYEEEPQSTVELVTISSTEADFGPVFYNGGLAFLSGRSRAMLKKKDRRTNSAYLQYYHAAFAADGSLLEPERLMKNTKLKFNDGPMTEGLEEGTLIVTRNVCKPSDEKGEEVFVLQLLEIEQKDNGKWSKPRPLSINDRNYSYGHPSLSADKSSLYFVSDMPGGLGGTDIYRSTWNGESWSDPVNLGPTINSPGDEMFPFVHHDTTLYFSSNGHPGLGGLDVYSANLFGETVLTNLGHPVNSSKDDFSLVIHESDTLGYFASNRGGGIGQDDLYRVNFKGQREETAPLMEQLAVELPDTLILQRKDVALLPPPEVTRDLLEDEIVGYTVQILAMKGPEEIQSKYFLGIQDIVFYDGKDGFRRYTHGIYPTFAQAMVAMKKIREMGIDDAFVRGLKRYEELSIKKYPVAFEAPEE